jgi:hypothetical protein
MEVQIADNNMFIHTLETVPGNWYLELEVRRGMTNREELIQNFKVAFNFEFESPLVDAALQVIKGKNFMEKGQVEIVPTCSEHRESATTYELLECYNNIEDGKEDPRNVHVSKIEGECDAVGPTLESDAYAKPIRVRKVKIDTKEKPKFANIGDYWNDETVENIADLLRDYQDLFPTTFLEMKRIVGELGEMKILLKPDVKPLNPKYKEKVNAKLDRMR